MLKKLLILAAGLALASPALAHHDRHKRHAKHPHAAAPILAPAPRVIYAPPPIVYAPPPVYHYYYYAPPAPVYYPAPPVLHRAPAPQSGVSIRLHFPL